MLYLPGFRQIKVLKEAVERSGSKSSSITLLTPSVFRTNFSFVLQCQPAIQIGLAPEGRFFASFLGWIYSLGHRSFYDRWIRAAHFPDTFL